MSSTHATEPPEDLCCLVTMEDITLENYAEFQTAPSGLWYPALFEASVVQQLLETQFHDYVKKVKESDCQAELRRLLASGPPIFLSDPHGLPLPEGETHVANVWFASSGTEQTAMLEGAVEGDEREQLWKELKQFLIEDGPDKED